MGSEEVGGERGSRRDRREEEVGGVIGGGEWGSRRDRKE